MPLEFYEIERVYYLKVCQSILLSSLSSSIFIKWNKICCQAFAARLLLLRHGFSCQAIVLESQISDQLHKVEQKILRSKAERLYKSGERYPEINVDDFIKL